MRRFRISLRITDYHSGREYLSFPPVELENLLLVLPDGEVSVSPSGSALGALVEHFSNFCVQHGGDLKTPFPQGRKG